MRGDYPGAGKYLDIYGRDVPARRGATSSICISNGVGMATTPETPTSTASPSPIRTGTGLHSADGLIGVDSRALDLGDDDPWLRGPRLCRLSLLAQGSPRGLSAAIQKKEKPPLGAAFLSASPPSLCASGGAARADQSATPNASTASAAANSNPLATSARREFSSRRKAHRGRLGENGHPGERPRRHRRADRHGESGGDAGGEQPLRHREHQHQDRARAGTRARGDDCSGRGPPGKGSIELKRDRAHAHVRRRLVSVATASGGPAR